MPRLYGAIMENIDKQLEAVKTGKPVEKPKLKPKVKPKVKSVPKPKPRAMKKPKRPENMDSMHIRELRKYAKGIGVVGWNRKMRRGLVSAIKRKEQSK